MIGTIYIFGNLYIQKIKKKIRMLGEESIHLKEKRNEVKDGQHLRQELCLYPHEASHRWKRSLGAKGAPSGSSGSCPQQRGIWGWQPVSTHRSRPLPVIDVSISNSGRPEKEKRKTLKLSIL